MTESQQLLGDYVQNGSEAAFRELVSRYVGLVYSAAIRLVDGDAHLAEDVAQTVFVDLARMACGLSSEVLLGGWLHRHTCFVASKTMRAERRRQARERQAVEMNDPEDHSAANLALIAPALDEAINQLTADDRAAILLRFFEQHDFRAVGAAMGQSEEAVRKRVDRALDKLQAMLLRRGVALSAAALATTLAAQAVAAAPAGLALSITTAAMAGAATGAGTALTLIKIMSMTKMKIGIIGAIVVAGVAVPLVIHQRAQNQLRAANEALQQEAEQSKRLAAENERLSKEVARASATPARAEDPKPEVLKLRGEVGRLRQSASEAAAAKANAPSALGGITSSPEMYKAIREQQKLGMTMIYRGLTNRMALDSEQVGKLNDLLADSVMENIDRITEVLREGKGPEQMEPVFAAQEAALLDKVRTLLGQEGLAEYQDYTRNLMSQITAEQFKARLSGDSAAKEAKAKQLYQLLQAEAQQGLANAGLPSDFQLVPSLNFRNFASEAHVEQSLKLLEGIYERVAAKSGAFLSAEELGKFGEFRASAINNNRMALIMNRKMMMPGSN